MQLGFSGTTKDCTMYLYHINDITLPYQSRPKYNSYLVFMAAKGERHNSLQGFRDSLQNKKQMNINYAAPSSGRQIKGGLGHIA